MKGLLWKDFYMIGKYCRSYLLIVIVFLVVSVWGDGNWFFMAYPAVVTSMLPMTLMSYEENCRWNQYGATFPYSRADIVSAKYIITLIFVGLLFLCTAIAQGIRIMNSGGGLFPGEWMIVSVLIAMVGLISPSILLPFLFRFGVAKGRIVYIGLMVIIFAFAGVKQVNGGEEADYLMNAGLSGPVLVMACLIIALLFLLSWFLSVMIYQHKEL